MRAFLGILTLSAVAVVGGLIGYNAGITSAAASSGATVVVTGGWPGFGSLFFLFLLFAFLVAAGGRRRHWAMGHHGGRGWSGPWGSAGGSGHAPADAADDPRYQWLSTMHRRLHEMETSGTPGANSGTAGGSNHPAAGPTGTPA